MYRFCNGNGNREIGRGAGAATAEHNEIFRSWQHLANAGLVAGSYTGVATSEVESEVIGEAGVNVPASKVGDGGGYLLWFRRNPDGISNQFPVVGYLLRYALWNGGTTNWNHNPILRPEDAWNIDSKIDDGLPGQGSVRSINNNTGTPNCVTSDDPALAEYDKSYADIACSIDFVF